MGHDEYRTAVLKGERTPEVEAHLEDCDACAGLARAIAAVQAELREPPPPTAQLTERVLERVRAARAARTAARGARLAKALALLGRQPARRASRRLLLGIATAAAVAIGALVIGQSAVTDNGAVAMTPLTGDCGHGASARAGAKGGDHRLKGQRVVVAGMWSGTERHKFAKVLERFEQRTGAEVTFAYETRNIAPALNARVKRGCPPDVAMLPQPGLLTQLARRGALKPIEGVAGDLVSRNYARSWRRLGTVDRKLYGVWFKAANKSTFWYRPAMFRRAGVEPPKNWDELKRIAGRLSAAGVVPFSVAGADGWTLTDWFENVYLRTAGSDHYDRLANQELSWTDRSVKRSLATLSQIFGKPHWLAGGSSGALDTSFEGSVHNVFGERRRAAMVYEGDFVASQVANHTSDPKATLGQDFDFFDFPAIGRSDSAAVIGGDVAALFTDNEAAKSLVRYLATPEAAQPWASAGGFVSPNKNLDPDAYVDAVNRRSARALQEAKTIRFDLSDQQPPAFGATAGQGMWQILRDYLRRPDDIDALTRRLDEAATAAERCERAVGGEC